ncbi:MAG: CBS domain-containing protein [Planctomycetota bacterium]|nr:MAG: CBS domain-containing protein [Planctomycetota bacterium]REJ97003.1 MAG: CBS domain-containing protein [Planctomycetota bacterium]REK20126.1 MAG: CBS domain-containing protein [Planctomycetota bacterium]REK34316.1 MAG: CBS domain-containing protein [Planctomycetota bacterium]
MADSGPQFDLRELLTTTVVGELTLTQVPILSPDATAAEAAAAMRAVCHGSALICDAGRIVGIITERDLLGLLVDDSKVESPLSAVMTTAPQTLTQSALLFDAVRLMDQGGYRRLPVVDADDKPAGIVDVKTVVNFLVEQMAATVYNQAENSLLTVRQREGA